MSRDPAAERAALAHLIASFCILVASGVSLFGLYLAVGG